MSALSLVEQASALVFPGFKFGLDDPASAERLVDLGVGGFCLYHGSTSEVAAFTRRLQERARRPLLFCADYEDGPAAHVSGSTGLPSNMALGAGGDEALAFEKGRLTAAEARGLGVRWVLAPVLDLATEPENPIVNTRSFGADPEAVTRLGRAYLRGLASLGVLSSVKHFPGHGGTVKDSHLELPVLRRSATELEAADLAPFRALRGEADSVMVAHLSIPSFDDGAPSSLSEAVIGGLLRRGLGYEKLVVTDALSMQAIAGRFSDEEACVAAAKAGADVLLVPAEPAAALRGWLARVEADAALQERVRASFVRLEAARAACGLDRDRGLPNEAELALVGCAAHRERAAAMAAACLSWIRRPSVSVAPKAVRYLEPDAGGPSEWQGEAFVDELRARGVAVAPYAPGGAGPVVCGCFLSPRAYTGRIRFSEEELAPAREAVASAPGSAVVSFGSPFLFDDFRGYAAGLCAFSGIEPAQRAAARVLLGLQEAPGRAPVRVAALR